MFQKFFENFEIVSGALAALVLLAGNFVIGAPIWASVTVAAALFAGLYLIGSFWTEIQIEREAGQMTLNGMRSKIREGGEMLRAIRELSRGMVQKEIREQVIRICDMGERIFNQLEADPSDILRSSRLLLYLGRFLPLIENYARVSSTRTGREMLGRDKEFLEVLNAVEQGFEQGFKNYLEKDVVEIKTMGRILKKMMNVAEIGK